MYRGRSAVAEGHASAACACTMNAECADKSGLDERTINLQTRPCHLIPGQPPNTIRESVMLRKVRRRRGIRDRDGHLLAGARIENREGHRTHPSSIHKMQPIRLRLPQEL